MSKRLKFFLGHLVISILFAIIVICIVFLLWYPYPLAKAVGVTSIFLMLVAIDMIVGPVLGLLVYKEGKKTLKMDLIVIILIQIMALIYGMYNIAQGRPVWIVQNGDRFELVRSNDIVQENIAEIDKKYKNPSWIKPQFVYINYGISDVEINESMMKDLMLGVSAHFYPSRYSDIQNAKQSMQDKMRDIDRLKQLNGEIVVQKLIEEYPQTIGWMPMSASDVDMTVLIDQNGEVVKIVDLRPW